MPAHLAALQHWMRDVITHPEGVAAGAQTDEAQARLDPAPAWFDDVVTRSRALTARQRLDIYHRGYFQRLLHCLGELLPVLRHALGPEIFERFAVEYLQHHPSRSYTLARLDDGFVAYLRETRPDRDRPNAERDDWPDFIIDLATLEHGIRVTFDGQGAEGEPLLDPATVAAWKDEQLLRAAFEPVPCLRVASFRFPVRAYLLAVRAAENPPFPAPHETHVAFNRRDFRVRLLELTGPQHDVLSALASGAEVAAAMRIADIEDTAMIRSWIRRFAESGLFRAQREAPSATLLDASEGEDR